MNQAPASNCVIVIACLRPGGAERVCTNLANRWAREGVSIDLVILDAEDQFAGYRLDPRIRQHHFGIKHGSYFFTQAMQLLSRWPNRPWLCFGHCVGVPLILARGFRRHPRIVIRCLSDLTAERKEARGIWARFVKPLITSALLRYSDKIICQTEAMKTSLVSNFKLPAKRMITLPNPLADEFRDRPLHALPPRGPILVVGRFSPEKDPMLALAAMTLAVKQEPNLCLRWVGHGPLREKVQQSVIDLTLQEHVTLLPVQQDIMHEYDQARVVMLCSKFEGFPNVLIEAIARGRPVVAIDCPTGPSEIVRPGNGILVRSRAPQDLADALIDCWRREWSPAQVAATLGDHDSAASYWSHLTRSSYSPVRAL